MWRLPAGEGALLLDIFRLGMEDEERRQREAEQKRTSAKLRRG